VISSVRCYLPSPEYHANYLVAEYKEPVPNRPIYRIKSFDDFQMRAARKVRSDYTFVEFEAPPPRSLHYNTAAVVKSTTIEVEYSNIDERLESIELDGLDWGAPRIWGEGVAEASDGEEEGEGEF
jgi:hypothetical protein